MDAIERGDLVHLDTTSEEWTDTFLVFAIESGLLSRWAASFPDSRSAPAVPICPWAPLTIRCDANGA
jgi:hypothetical protein